MIPLDEIFQRRKRVIAACLVAGSLYLCGPYFQRVLQRDGPSKNTNILPSPRSTLLPYLGFDDVAALTYTPDLLPGGRYVETPYGVMRVFEWGPEAGEKVLLLHGVGTPAIALGQLAKILTDKGYRVMLFGEYPVPCFRSLMNEHPTLTRQSHPGHRLVRDSRGNHIPNKTAFIGRHSSTDKNRFLWPGVFRWPIRHSI